MFNPSDTTKTPSGFPWPLGDEAQDLLTRRIEICAHRRDRAWDLLVEFWGCVCGAILPDVRYRELTGLGAERVEDLARLLRQPLAGPAPDRCPACGEPLSQETSARRVLFTHAADIQADLVTVSDAEQMEAFVWSHENGSVQPVQATNTQPSQAKGVLDPFLTASAFRQALGQVRFDEPEHPPALRSCLRRNPNFLPAVELTAQIRMAQGRYSEAAALFRRVVRESPGRVEAWYALGLCLTETMRSAPDAEKAPLAEQALRSLIEAQNRSISAKPAHYRATGTLLLMVGQNEAAADQLERALELDENHFDTVLHLGMARLRTGGAREALVLFERAHAGRPEDPLAALWLAECLTELGQVEEALSQLEQCRNLGAPLERIAALEEQLALRGNKA